MARDGVAAYLRNPLARTVIFTSTGPWIQGCPRYLRLRRPARGPVKKPGRPRPSPPTQRTNYCNQGL